MVHKLTKIGLVVIVASFLFGFVSSSLKTFPFIREERFQSGTSDQIPIDGSYIDIPLIEGISHPFSFQMIIEWDFHSPSGSEFSVSSSVIISKAGQVIGTIPGTTNDNYWISSDEYTQSHYISVPSKYGSSSFSLYARVQGQPESQEAVNDLYIENIRVYITYTFYMIVSPLVFIAGTALVIAGYIINRKQKAKKPVEVKWEPTLKWRGESPITGDTKAPKMAIKTTPQAKKKVKKVVKKASPKAGDTKTCKYCGKSVQRSVFFCPHCYGKLS